MNKRAPPPAIISSNVELAKDVPTFKNDGRRETPVDAIDPKDPNVVDFAATALVSRLTKVERIANISLNMVEKMARVGILRFWFFTYSILTKP